MFHTGLIALSYTRVYNEKNRSPLWVPTLVTSAFMSRWTKSSRKEEATPKGFQLIRTAVMKDHGEQFLTDFDKEAMDSLTPYNGRAKLLIKVATPALISLALCPATLYLYRPLAAIFWPADMYDVPPDINEAIACFLAPAGLVYATSFAFAFDQVLGKQREIMAKLSHELGLLDQIVTMTSKMSFPSTKDRMDIYRLARLIYLFSVIVNIFKLLILQFLLLTELCIT